MALSHCLDVANYWILQCVLIVDAPCCAVLLLSLALPFAQDPGATSALLEAIADKLHWESTHLSAFLDLWPEPCGWWRPLA